jgi:hypothetical protein
MAILKVLASSNECGSLVTAKRRCVQMTEQRKV